MCVTKKNAVRVAKSVAGGRKQKKQCVAENVAWRAGAKKTRDKTLNQKRKIINLKFKINTKFQHLKIRAEFKIVKIIKILKY